MTKKILFIVLIGCLFSNALNLKVRNVDSIYACTNFLVTKGATVDGSTMLT